MSWKAVVGEELKSINCEILPVPLKMDLSDISTPEGGEKEKRQIGTNFSYHYFLYSTLETEVEILSCSFSN